MSACVEAERVSIQYPGGLSARYRWAGSGRAAEVFGISEATGRLTDHGPLVDPRPDRLCRAELRMEGPLGQWTARFASPVYDQPEAVLWDGPALLLVKYGFRLYALASRTGVLAWSYGTSTPTVAVLASPDLDHALLQTEVETIALRADGEVAWRAAHDDVVVGAALIAGRLALSTYGGQQLVLDARSGRPA